ncbi:DUF177 domain-containing protein [Breoghania sp. L-A4]|uniref:YceD family protein n=1 Tax=Breoghania sp. L-A4 TaxID=2304600 RepID=UPI000E35F04A|nr:DUF177 domain-containing protein [Breoghania sp. L-A4]AXS40271.1 DUF177 domain-containing protein [Breoghania sp. L-A4]
MTLISPPLRWRQMLDAIPPGGTRFERAASEEERAALRDAYGLVDVLSFKVAYEIRPWRKNGYRVLGPIDAEVVQTCVVTLEPVVQAIHETVDMTFLPQAEAERLAARQEEEGEIIVDMESRDPPEGFTGTSLDIGGLSAEQLALAIDDYPRKPGVDFETAVAAREGGAAVGDAAEDASDAPPAKRSPFAALAAHALAKKNADDDG